MEDFENKNFLQKNVVTLVVVIVLVAFGYLLYNGWDKIVNDGIDDMTTITGRFSCLPFKDSSLPAEKDCELGIKSRDDAFYALDISRVQDANSDLKVEDTIAVTGFVLPESEISISKWASYNIKGIIQVNMLLRTR
ncbi:MAG: hypothetical protein AAB690_01010 [Patescibacteria group bacterium]